MVTDHIDFHDTKKYHFDLFKKGRVEVLAIDGSIERIQLDPNYQHDVNTLKLW